MGEVERSVQASGCGEERAGGRRKSGGIINCASVCFTVFLASFYG